MAPFVASMPASMPARVMVPAEALSGDTLAIMTQVGLFEMPLPFDFKAGQELTIDVPIPVGSSPIKKLVVAFCSLKRDGVEVAIEKMTDSPTKRSHSPKTESPRKTDNPRRLDSLRKFGSSVGLGSSGSGVANGSDGSSDTGAQPTRRARVRVPPGAKPGDMLALQTEVGLFQVRLPSKHGSSLVAQLPVPADCPLSKLTVAWVRVSDTALAAVAITGGSIVDRGSIVNRNSVNGNVDGDMEADVQSASDAASKEEWAAGLSLPAVDDGKNGAANGSSRQHPDPPPPPPNGFVGVYRHDAPNSTNGSVDMDPLAKLTQALDADFPPPKRKSVASDPLARLLRFFERCACLES